jgi:hypothetical protein
MSARDHEAYLLARCKVVASGVATSALDDIEANVFLLASLFVKSNFPREASALLEMSKQYFKHHPNKKLSSAEVIRHGWILSAPRFRDMLSRQLRHH